MDPWKLIFLWADKELTATGETDTFTTGVDYTWEDCETLLASSWKDPSSNKVNTSDTTQEWSRGDTYSYACELTNTRRQRGKHEWLGGRNRHGSNGYQPSHLFK